MAAYAKILLTLGSGEQSSDVTRLLQAADTGSKHQQIIRLLNYIGSIETGARQAQMSVNANIVFATGTFTFTAAATANDTVVINGVTFTAVASGATGNQWNVGASLTATAANLVIGINASATALVNTTLVASSALGVVTITAVQGGVLGNCITIAKGVDAGAANTASGARLTGGTEGTAVVTNYGSN